MGSLKVPIHSDLSDLAADLYNQKTNEHLSSYAQELFVEFAERLASLQHRVKAECVELDSEGDVPTVAQGVALAQFLRPEFRRADVLPIAHVCRSGGGLPEDYLHIRTHDGYEGGIDREGRVST